MGLGHCSMKEILRRLLGTGDTVERTALSYSIGVFLGFSPLLGLQTVTGIGISIVFGLNRVAMLAGIYTNLPWLVPVVYGFAGWLGIQLFGLPEGAELPSWDSTRLTESSFWRELGSNWRLVVPVALGSTVMATVLALISYPLILALLRRYKARELR